MEVIYGKVPSKSNSYKIVTLKSREGKMYSSLAKGKELKEYEKNFYLQISSELRGLELDGLFEFYVNIYYPSNRLDLDNGMKILLDCLQATRTIKNDNKCVKIVAQKFIDKDRPRVEFEVKEVTFD